MLADALELQAKNSLALAEAVHALAQERDETRLNLTEAAKEHGVTTSFLRQAIRRGDLPAERFGRRAWRVARADVLDLCRVRGVL